MAEIKLTEEQLAKLAKIAETIKEKGAPAAEKMLDQFKAEFKAPPTFRVKAVTCDTCMYCGVCGPTSLAWVGVDLVVKVAD
jgi:hypothetical protein